MPIPAPALNVATTLGKAGRVAAVVAATFTDGLRRAYMTGEDGPGLRGGTFDVEFTDTQTNLDLAAARYAGDVRSAATGRCPSTRTRSTHS